MMDGEIAAIAQTNKLTLITRNVHDFANYDGLVVENWFLP
jgi:tRNA(fMet)-specific endonuclease VapC